MKKFIVAGMMALGFLSATAQTKIGHINSEQALGLMPEAIKVDAEIKEYQNSLVQQGQDLQAEVQKKSDDFVKDSGTFSAQKKEIIRSEIVKLYQRLQGYETEMQESLQKYADNKINPLRAKLFEAIKVVAKEKGYAYVINEASNALLISPDADDLLPAVKLKLGIKDAPPVPTPPATKAPVKNSN